MLLLCWDSPSQTPWCFAYTCSDGSIFPMDLRWGKEKGIPCLPPCIPEDGCCRELGSFYLLAQSRGGCSLQFMVQPFILASLFARTRVSLLGLGTMRQHALGKGHGNPLQLIAHFPPLPQPKARPCLALAVWGSARKRRENPEALAWL